MAVDYREVNMQLATESLSAVSATDYQLHDGWIDPWERSLRGLSLETSDVEMDVPSDWGRRKVEDYLVRIREPISINQRYSRVSKEESEKKLQMVE